LLVGKRIVRLEIRNTQPTGLSHHVRLRQVDLTVSQSPLDGRQTFATNHQHRANAGSRSWVCNIDWRSR